MIKRFFLASTILVSVFSCRIENSETPVMPKEPAIKYLKWLCGTWKFTSQEGTMYEIWHLENDSLMIGHGFFISGKDTVFSEKLELKQVGQDLFYIPTVADQNGGKPVPFKFSGIDKGEYLFVNAEHDFPQRIIYKNPQPDFLSARIEGQKDGKFRKEDFNFLKIK